MCLQDIFEIMALLPKSIHSQENYKRRKTGNSSLVHFFIEQWNSMTFKVKLINDNYLTRSLKKMKMQRNLRWLNEKFPKIIVPLKHKMKWNEKKNCEETSTSHPKKFKLESFDTLQNLLSSNFDIFSTLNMHAHIPVESSKICFEYQICFRHVWN